VNNASVVSRIGCYANSILLCGDMEKEAWECVLNHPIHALFWRPLVSKVDVLVAPHHGHKSGFSTTLMDLAAPNVVLVSAASKDPSLDHRYSLVPGIELMGRSYKCLTTRDWGHIHFSISPPKTLFGRGHLTWHDGPAARSVWAAL
jgi:beta-lactamase superfamily II metal-dependent hydrolase